MEAHEDLFVAAEKLLDTECSGKATARVWVPGRIEVVGKHTDYAKGSSLVCAIDKGLAFVYCTREDRKLKVLSCNTPEGASNFVEFDFEASAEATCNGEKTWSVYVGAVVQFFAIKNSFPKTGVTLAVNSSLPQNAGLSSSSALVCGVAAILSKLSGLQLSMDDLGRIESMDLVGTRGGSQDHAAIMLSEQGKLSLFQYVNGTELVRRIAFDPDLVFVIAVSGVSACKTGNALEKYNALAGASDEEKIERAKHESQVVVPMMCKGFETHDHALVGKAIELSQAHAEKVLFTSVPETEWLAHHAVELGAIGSTTFGAGFGGSVYALVSKATASEFMEEWKSGYTAAFQECAASAVFFTTSPSAGTTFL